MSASQREVRSVDGRQWVVVVLFGIYLLLLVWIVVWKLEAPHVGGGALRRVKLVPFVTAGDDGASSPVEVLANVLLFTPFGVYLGLIVPSWSWPKRVAAVAGASLLLELTQYVLAVGSSDVSDLIANTVGGLVGMGVLARARHGLRERTAALMPRVCLTGTVLAVVLVGAFVASPVRYAQRDPGVAPERSAPIRDAGHR